MASVDLVWKNGRFGQTSRRDTWWLEPLLVFLGLGAFVVYATWAAFQGNHYWHNQYLSPFYSPEIFGDSPHSLFGPKPAWWPAFMPFSPALLILWAPGLFRFTCYYYRGAYYKAFWADPPACAVSEPRNGYRGEKLLPLVLHNVHRYIFYAATIVWFFLLYDAFVAFRFPDGSLGVGVGTIVLWINVIFLGGYAFGCHCSRHLTGGFLDAITSSPVRHKLYNAVSWLNANHKKWAWASLFSVAFSDIYVRLCSMGIWSDWRIL
ncbi:MAG: succinate dehydrogenase [Acidobacteria bacterium]|nr:succinate dehydrogenase [Acidobacteriota bacterium]